MCKINFHYSKIGYDVKKKKSALISCLENEIFTEFSLVRLINAEGATFECFTSKPKFFGEMWGFKWYVLDFTDYDVVGTYSLQIKKSDGTCILSEATQPIDIGENLLWNRAWYSVSLEQLDVREKSAYVPEGGWRDCGSPLQEASSHLIMLDSVCDLHESEMLPPYLLKKVQHHLCVGADYICNCQKKAEELGFGKGAVLHEIRENQTVSAGNCARTAVVLSRVAKLLLNVDSVNAKKYLSAAKTAFDWIYKNGATLYNDDTGNLKITHGALEDFTVAPNQFMTRDLMSLSEAALSLNKFYKDENYEKIAFEIAEKIVSRQVKKENAEDGYFGHFYTFDEVNFTEKANLHCGAWNLPYKNYNQGSHMPYWILPLIKIAQKYPNTEIGEKCAKAVNNFAYGFLLPTTKANPFGIIPAGYYLGQGLMFFSGWYHGHNKIYGFACKLASMLAEYLKDEQFQNVATDNLQWLAGLNYGVNEGDVHVSKSFVVGVGSVYHEDWNHLRGTVINGFDVNKQFSVHPVIAEKDLPIFLDDEGGIHHSSGFLSGLCFYTKN